MFPALILGNISHLLEYIAQELPMLAGLNKPSLKDRQTQNLDSNKKP